MNGVALNIESGFADRFREGGVGVNIAHELFNRGFQLYGDDGLMN